MIPGLEQWVKDLALPQLWPRSQMRFGFNPWTRIVHVLWVQLKKAGKKKKKQIQQVVPVQNKQEDGKCKLKYIIILTTK